MLTEEYPKEVTKVVFDISFKSYQPTTTCEWFTNMNNLKEIKNIEYLDTKLVTDMTNMFAWCKSLENLDVSRFNTANVTRMDGMFYRCESLETLDLYSFDIRNVTDFTYMFSYCVSLQKIYVGNKNSNWNTSKVTYSTKMFLGCWELVGGSGTKYRNNTENDDATYAHIDEEYYNPGYFTKIEKYDLWVCGTQVSELNWYDTFTAV